MEFTRELMIMDEVLLEILRSKGDTKSWQSDEIKQSEVIRLFHDKIESNRLQDSEECMRKINMYLLLKCDLMVSDMLEEDLDVGHIIERKFLLEFYMNVVWELHLQNYFYEAIVYCPPVMSHELIQTATHLGQNSNCTNDKLSARRLAEAIYLKILRIERNAEEIKQEHRSCVLQKLYDHFLKTVKCIESIGVDDLSLPSDVNLASTLVHTLILLKYCLKHYFNNVTYPSPRQYQMSLNYNYNSHWLCATSDCTSMKEFNLALILIGIHLFEKLSVDIWCSFSEHDSGVDGKTFQKLIGEEIHACLPLLKELLSSGKCSKPETNTLILMLSTMSIKPWDEDDEIKVSNLDDILNSVYDESKTRSKWLYALLQFEEKVLLKESCLSCIEENLSLLESKHVHLLLRNVVNALHDSEGNEDTFDYRERLKKLALNSFMQFSVEEQLQHMEEFFTNFNVNNYLCLFGFPSTVTEVFNKAICVEGGNNDEFFAGCVMLCLQSPEELLMKLLSEGLGNPYLAAPMTRTVKGLKSIANMRAMDEKGTASNANLITSLVVKLMERTLWSEQERDHFPRMVGLLIDASVLGERVFCEECLIPMIYRSLEASDWEMLLLWLRTFSEVARKDNGLNVCPLIVILANILEKSRCDMTSFTMHRIEICEESLKLVDRFLQYLQSEKYDEKSKNWLKFKLADLNLSPVNRLYFEQLLPSENYEMTMDDNCQFVLFSAIKNGRVTEDILKIVCDDSEAISLHLWSSLLKVLPGLTAKEWRNLTGVVKVFVGLDEVEELMLLFNTIVETQLFFFLLQRINDEFKENAHTLSFLKFSLQNIGFLIQNELLPKVQILSPTNLREVFEKTLLMLEKSPAPINELCSPLLVPVLTKVMCAAVEHLRNEPELADSMLVKQICCAICTSSIPDTRVALARRLSELIDSAAAKCPTA